MPYVTHLRDRRQARAVAIQQLAQAEATPWIAEDGSGGGGPEAVRAALAGFEAQALVVGMPKRVVRTYTRLTEVGRIFTQQAADLDEVPGIPIDLARVRDDARDLVIDHLWQPRRSRLRYRRRLKRLLDRVEQVRAKHPDRAWAMAWDR
jgi:hypothetical protein